MYFLNLGVKGLIFLPYNCAVFYWRPPSDSDPNSSSLSRPFLQKARTHQSPSQQNPSLNSNFSSYEHENSRLAAGFIRYNKHFYIDIFFSRFSERVIKLCFAGCTDHKRNRLLSVLPEADPVHFFGPYS